MTIASTLRLFLPAVAALTLQVSAAAQGVQEAAASKPSRGLVVGLVDVLRALEQYPRFIKLRADLDATAKKYEAQLQEISVRIDELRGTIQVLADGSQERAEKEFANNPNPAVKFDYQLMRGADLLTCMQSDPRARHGK